MKARHILIVIACIVVIAIGLLVWNWQSLMIGYHKRQRLAELHEIEIAPPGDHTSQFQRFMKHQESLVQLKYFSYKEIPFKEIKAPSEEFNKLFAELNKETTIVNGYFMIHGSTDNSPAGIQIWGIKDQMDLIVNIVTKHDIQK